MAAASFHVLEHSPSKPYMKIHNLTIEEILNGKQLEYPRVSLEVIFKKAKDIEINDEERTAIN